MTPHQIALLDLIRDAIERTGVAPSYDELAQKLGLRSRGSTHTMVDRLIRDGHLVRLTNQHRGLALPGVDLRGASTQALEAELTRRGHHA